MTNITKWSWVVESDKLMTVMNNWKKKLIFLLHVY